MRKQKFGIIFMVDYVILLMIKKKAFTIKKNFFHENDSIYIEALIQGCHPLKQAKK